MQLYRTNVFYLACVAVKSDCSSESTVWSYHLYFCQKLAIISLSCILLCPSYPKKIYFLPTNLFKMLIFPAANIAHTVGWWLWLTTPLSPFICDAGVTVLTVAAASICTDILWYEYSPKYLGTLCRCMKLANMNAPHFSFFPHARIYLFI